jgi:hypothetical protein
VKPKHTAEQSTIKVNKGAAMGKVGFASIFNKQPAVTATVSTPEPEVKKVEQVVLPDQKPEVVVVDEVVEEVVKNEAPQTVVNNTTSPVSPISASATMPPVDMQKRRMQDELVIHGPVDPMDALLCEGCQ